MRTFDQWLFSKDNQPLDTNPQNLLALYKEFYEYVKEEFPENRRVALERLHTLAQQHNDEETVMFCVHEHGTLKPVEYIQLLENTMEVVSSPNYLISLHLNKASALLKMNLGDEALKSITDAEAQLKLLKQSQEAEKFYFKKKVDVVSIYMEYHTILGNLQEALETSKQLESIVLSHTTSINEQYLQEIAYRMFATRSQVFARLGKIDEAKNTLEQYINDFSINEQSDDFVHTFYNYAIILNELGDYIFAAKICSRLQQYFQDSQVNLHKGASQYWQRYLLSLQGSVEVQSDNTEKGTQFFEAAEQALLQAEESDPYFASELYKIWASALEKLGQHSEALKLLRKHIEVKDILHNDKLQEQASFTNARLKLELAMEQQRTLRKHNKEMASQLEEIRGDLRRHLAHQIHADEQVRYLQSLITEIEKANSSSSIAAVTTQMSSILQQMDTQLYKKNQLNSADDNNTVLQELLLRADIPLTHTEQQVVLLLHQGMLTKQIASLLHITDGYVRQVSKSIRNKLQVPPRVNLKTFLHEGLAQN